MNLQVGIPLVSNPQRARVRSLAREPKPLASHKKTRNSLGQAFPSRRASRASGKLRAVELDVHHFSTDVQTCTDDFSQCCNILLTSVEKRKNAVYVAASCEKARSTILQAVHAARNGDPTWVDNIDSLQEFYSERFSAEEAQSPLHAKSFEELTFPVIDDLKIVLKSVHCARVCPSPIFDEVESLLIQLEAYLFSAFLQGHGIEVARLNYKL